MTSGDGAAFPLRLTTRIQPSIEPVGLVVRKAQATALLARLRPRASFYPALRLALAADLAVFFADKATPLPFVEAPIAWLQAEGVLFLPSGLRLDAPAPLRPEIARRLLQRHNLAGPAALLMPREGGRLRLVDLSASRALLDLDFDRLASLVR